jgi:hypothetical protein
MTRAPAHIVWFKRDLRVQDHRPLVEAARLGPVAGPPSTPRPRPCSTRPWPPRTAEAWQRILSDPASYPGLHALELSRAGSSQVRPTQRLAKASRPAAAVPAVY